MKDAYVADALIMLAVPFRLPVDCQCESAEELATCDTASAQYCALKQTRILRLCKNRKEQAQDPKRRQRFFAVREMHVFGESVPMSCLSSLLSWGYHADERLLAVHIWLFLQEQIKDIIILFSSFWRFL